MSNTKWITILFSAKLLEQWKGSFFETLMHWFSLAFYGMVSYISCRIVYTLYTHCCVDCTWLLCKLLYESSKVYENFKKSFECFDKNFVTVVVISWIHCRVLLCELNVSSVYILHEYIAEILLCEWCYVTVSTL